MHGVDIVKYLWFLDKTLDKRKNMKMKEDMFSLLAFGWQIIHYDIIPTLFTKQPHHSVYKNNHAVSSKQTGFLI